MQDDQLPGDADSPGQRYQPQRRQSGEVKIFLNIFKNNDFYPNNIDKVGLNERQKQKGLSL